MANILQSSICKKIVMSLSGLFLILFVTLHALLNGAYLFGAEEFDAVCNFMKNPIVSTMVPVLAIGVLIHFIFAIIINIQDYRARGRVRYAVANKAKTDLASRNMFVIGILLLVGLGIHLTHFWGDMQLVEWLQGGGGAVGSVKMIETFSCTGVYLLYVVWFGCLWFHLSHGFWSAFQTLGLCNERWFIPLKIVGICYSSLLVLLFIAVATKGFIMAQRVL